MKNTAGIIGWLLLAVVLAVPAFLFYNWWTGNKKNAASGMVPVRSVSAADAFAGAQEKSVAATDLRPAPVSGAAPAADVSRVVTRSTDKAPVPVAGAQLSTQPAAARAGKALSAPVSTGTALGSYFSPKSERDPTMTPADYRRKKEDDRKRLEEERLRQLALRKQLKEDSGENRIKLQGIVGNNVIINGEMYSVGNTVSGVKILEIRPSYIVGKYKGKKFKKALQ